MQVVCEATQNPAVMVQIAAFETLVRIMSLYYDKMSYYMERALFGLTVLGMNHPDERVAQQAVEFWSTVCEEEIDLAIEAADVSIRRSCLIYQSDQPLFPSHRRRNTVTCQNARANTSPRLRFQR